MYKTIVIGLLTAVTLQSFAFDIGDFKKFKCQNINHRVQFDFEKAVAIDFFTFQDEVSKIENVQINRAESSIQFDQVAQDGSVVTLTLKSIQPGHAEGIAYAYLYLAGKNVSSCGGYW